MAASAAATATAAAEKSSSKGQAWFCTTGLPSDIVVEVDDMTFHLHKFPLMSKSQKLHNLITEQEANPSNPHQQVDNDVDDEIEEVQCQISLSDFPGGSETFEIAAKFCYGVKIDLSSSNVVPLRCAGEYLEMTEEYSEDNLISKTERFLTQSVLKSFKESLRALKSCERVAPLAEKLGITQRCIDSVASRATSADPTLFGWPVGDGGPNRNTNADTVSASSASKQQILWNGIDAGGGRRRSKHADSWLEDLVVLSLPLFKRLISAMKSGDLSLEMVETCLMHYAKKYIPGISRTNRKPSSSSSGVAAATIAAASSGLAAESQQRELLETVISNLPLEKSSRPSTATPPHLGRLHLALWPHLWLARPAHRRLSQRPLPTQILNDDDAPAMELNSKTNKSGGYGFDTDAPKVLFPFKFPYGGTFGVSSDFISPVESSETESDEEDYLAGLTRQMARSTLDDEFKYPDSAFASKKPKGWVASGSPQSTLCAVGSGCGCGQGSSRGSPRSQSLRRAPTTKSTASRRQRTQPATRITFVRTLAKVPAAAASAGSSASLPPSSSSPEAIPPR